MKLTMSIRELLSASNTKRDLTCMLAQGLLDYFCSSTAVKLVVVYSDKIKGLNFEDHSHEEADILIPPSSPGSGV